jgi:hypothetical protein
MVTEEVAESSSAVALIASCVGDCALRSPLSIELERVDEPISAAINPKQTEMYVFLSAISLSDFEVLSY